MRVKPGRAVAPRQRGADVDAAVELGIEDPRRFIGAGDDPAGKFGVASLTAAMLDEGAGSRSALQIADDVEFLGADLGTSSSFDASAVRLNVPAARLAAALPIMADVALRPTFPQAELDRLRQERLTTLLQARDDAAQVAPLAFGRVVFGGTHR